MRKITTNFDCGRVFLYLFSFLLLVQFQLALILSTLDISINAIKLLFALKQVVVIVFFPIAAIYLLLSEKIHSVDKWAILFGCAVVTSVFLSNADQKAVIYGVKLYLNPVLLYAIGRVFRSGHTRRDVNFVMILFSLAIIIFEMLFYFLGEKTLSDLNIEKIYAARGDSVEKGYNLIGSCYFHNKEGVVMRRAFGPFFDPLTFAFFSVPILFWFRYKRRSLFESFLYYSVIIIVLLSLTRAIIGACIIGYMFTGMKKGRYFARTKKLAFCILIGFIVIGVFIKELLSVVDPSTWGHLSAYYNLVGNIINHPFGLGYFRNAETKIDIGFHSTESIYLAMALENGVPFLLIFLIFAYKLHKALIINGSGLVQFTAHSSLLVYGIASLTTEHWFAISSSSMFWILAGYAVADLEKSRHQNEIHDASMQFKDS
ncbi:MAG: hypothetical protein JXB48_20870 [Candidatus Latescibacteria bacterium]|nr:hypothetical protein [Candidatus Latescibacterota bacterium]